MQFTDVFFVFTAPIASLFYFAVPKPIKKIWLLLLNLLFIYTWGVFSLKIILLEVAVSYLAAIIKEKAANARIGKFIIVCGILAIVGLFLYYKYFNFALETLYKVIGREFTRWDIAAPIGISFYSLQIIGYLSDVCTGKEKAETNFINYAVFVTFFPLILSGPIERSNNFLKQIKERENIGYSYDRIREGLLYALWGFFLKMVIADRASTVVATIFNNYTSYRGFPLAFGAVIYALQLYADFSGYSYTAFGIGKVLGFDIIQNFNYPYMAETVGQFWRRWHISLSGWLRDYIYIPLGGSRCSRAKKYFNIAATFLVSGLWHGSSWTFAAWGGLHAVYQILGDALKPTAAKANKIFKVDESKASYKFARRLRTFILVDIAWVYFRSATFEQAWYIVRYAFPVKNFGMIFNGGLYGFGLNQRNMNILLLGILILFVSSLLSERRKKAAILCIGEQGVTLRYAFYWLIVTLIVISINTSSSEFLYMQF